MFHIDSFESIKNGRGRPKITAPSEREFNMKDMFVHGKTLQEIGDLQTPPLSRERVRQLLKKFFNIIGNDGGRSLRTFPIILAKLKDKEAKKEKKYQRIFGCSSNEFIKINGSEWDRKKRTLGAAFYSQKHTANARGIKFDLTFPEWFEIWQKSGKLELRGRGAGYCMARIGDTGGYSIDNVEIITIGKNFSDSYLKHSQEERNKKAIENGKVPTIGIKKEICIRGHKMTVENTRVRKNGSRICCACEKLRAKKYYVALKSRQEYNHQHEKTNRTT